MSRLAKSAAVLAAVSALTLVGLLVPFDRYVLLVVAGILVAAGPLLLARHLRSFGPGLAALLVMAVLVPLDVGTGESAAERVQGAFSVFFLFAAFLCGTWLLRLALVRRRLALDPSRLVVAALVFVAIALLSFVVGQFPWFDVAAAPMRAQLGGLALFVVSAGIFLVVAHEVASLDQMRRLTWWFLGAGAVAVVAMLIPGAELSIAQVKVLTHGTVGSLFFTWVVAMSISQAAFNRSLTPATRVLLAAIGALALARCLFITFSWASGWIPAVATLGLLLLFRFPRTVLCATLLLAAPVLLVSGWAWDSMMEQESWSWLTRVEALKTMRQVIEREPWLGLGPANYKYYTPLFKILGYNVRFNSHNNYVDLLAQTGIVGLLAFSWFALEAARLGFRVRAGARDGFTRAYATGVLAGLAGSLVAGFLADWIVPFVYNIGIVGFRSSVLFWFFLGGLLALSRLADVSAPVPSAVRPAVREAAVARA